MSVPALLHEFINNVRYLKFFWAQVGVRGWWETVSLADLQSKGLGERLVRVSLADQDSR